MPTKIKQNPLRFDFALPTTVTWRVRFYELWEYHYHKIWLDKINSKTLKYRPKY